MQSKDSPYGPVTWYDNSMLDSYRECPRKYWNTWERVLRGVDWHPAGPSYFAFGHAVHTGMEALFRHSIEDAIRAFDTSWDAWVALGGTGDDKRNKRNGHLLLMGYKERYKQWMQGVRVLETEYKFSVSIHGYKQGEACYRGVIDHIGETKDGDVYAIDFKTASMNSANNMIAMRLRNQFMGYYWALSQNPEYAHRLRKRRFIVDFLISQKSGVEFERQEAIVDDWAIREWLEETALTMRTIEINRALQVWQKNTQSCHNYGSLCPYFSLCATAPEMRVKMEDAMFVEKNRDEVSMVGGEF